MDRSDELKPDHTHDHTHDHQRDEIEQDDDRPVREGDILGLGGAPVPKTPGDPTTEYDADSVAQRRARALEDEEAHRTDTRVRTDSKGATGIDMGAGGNGTDISGQ